MRQARLDPTFADNWAEANRPIQKRVAQGKNAGLDVSEGTRPGVIVLLKCKWIHCVCVLIIMHTMEANSNALVIGPPKVNASVDRGPLQIRPHSHALRRR